MDLTNRVNTAHGVLVFLELATVLVTGMVTIFAILLAEGVASTARPLGDHPSIGAETVDLGIALLTVLLLASLGGFAVIGYHDFFDRSFGNLGLLPMAIVPLVGVVAPVAYVSIGGGTASLPAWAFAIVFVSSYVLALRFVAVHSMLERWRRAAVFVGIGTCVPAAVALMQFVTDVVLWSGNDRTTGTILSLATENGVPSDRRLLVALPLTIAALLAIHRTVSAARRWAPLRPSLGVSMPTPGRSIRRTIDRVRGRVPSIRDSSNRFGLPALAGLSSSNSASSSRSAPSRSIPSKSASSPGSASPGSSSRSSSGGSSSTGTSGSSAGSPSSGSSGSSTSRSATRSSSTVPPPSSPSPDRRSKRGDRGSSPNDGSTSGDGSESNRDSSRSGSANRSGAATDGNDVDAGSAGTASSSGVDETDDGDGNGSIQDGTGSDTRIFTDDSDQYGTDGDPVEHCPDCGETLPSDGVYRFCPFCGHEV